MPNVCLSVEIRISAFVADIRTKNVDLFRSHPVFLLHLCVFFYRLIRFTCSCGMRTGQPSFLALLAVKNSLPVTISGYARVTIYLLHTYYRLVWVRNFSFHIHMYDIHLLPLYIWKQQAHYVEKTKFNRSFPKLCFVENYSNILSNKTIQTSFRTKLFDYLFKQNYSTIFSNKTIQ
jgi:hypothetical protein